VGDTHDDHVIVLIPSRINENPLWYVAAHEFGHSFGMEHVSDERAIMYRTNTDVTARCVTQADLEELCRVGNCVRSPVCNR
jgi:predicted Zn-dependent protease